MQLRSAADGTVEWSPASTKLCYLAAFIEVARQLSFNIEEHVLFSVCSGPDFSYSYIHENVQVSAPRSPNDWLSVVGAQDIRYSDLQYVGITATAHSFRSADDALASIVSVLAEQKIVIVYVDVFYLSYHPFSGNRHSQGSLVISSADLHSNNVAFVDPHVHILRAQRVTGRLSITELGMAMASDVLLQKQIVSCAKHEAISSSTMRRIVRNNLLETCGRFLRPQNPYSGVPGIRLLSSDLRNWNDTWQNGALAANCLMAYFHVTGRGGPAATRQVFAEALRMSPELFSRADTAAFDGFSQSAKKWGALGATFFRGSTRAASSLVSKAARQLAEIASLEEELFLMIMNDPELTAVAP
jgi:hypothetical protein